MPKHEKNKPSANQPVSAYDMPALSDKNDHPPIKEGSPAQQARVRKLKEVGANLAKNEGLMAQAGVILPRQAQLAEDFRHMPPGIVPSSIHVSQEAKDQAIARQQIAASTVETPVDHRLTA